MATLALPPPKNDHESSLAAFGGPGLGEPQVDGSGSAGTKSDELVRGVIYPSREIRGEIKTNKIPVMWCCAMKEDH